MTVKTAAPSVAQHFEGKPPALAASYRAILKAARRFGSVMEDPKKTSIHLVKNNAFAGIATRKEALILTLKSSSDIRDKRIARREQASANRWHVEVRVADPSDVDAQLVGWLRDSYTLAK
jgi:hypothetical protein